MGARVRTGTAAAAPEDPENTGEGCSPARAPLQADPSCSGNSSCAAPWSLPPRPRKSGGSHSGGSVATVATARGAATAAALLLLSAWSLLPAWRTAAVHAGSSGNVPVARVPQRPHAGLSTTGRAASTGSEAAVTAGAPASLAVGRNHNPQGGAPATASTRAAVPPGLAAARRLLIEGGSLALPARFPYVVAVVQPRNGAYLCVGTLINPRLVLTAAHCVAPEVEGSPNPLVASPPDGRLGLVSAQSSAQPVSTTLFQVQRSRSYVHPKYVAGQFDYDVAALVLARPMLRQQARLPDQGASFSSSTGKGGGMVVLGWGATADGKLSNALRQAYVQPVDKHTCEQQFERFGSDVTNQMACVTGRTCAGDSGGPVVLEGRGGDLALGQVSFGFPRRKGQGCPIPNPSTVITDFSSPAIRSFIQDMLAEVGGTGGAARVRGFSGGDDYGSANITADTGQGGEGTDTDTAKATGEEPLNVTGKDGAGADAAGSEGLREVEAGIAQLYDGSASAATGAQGGGDVASEG